MKFIWFRNHILVTLTKFSDTYINWKLIGKTGKVQTLGYTKNIHCEQGVFTTINLCSPWKKKTKTCKVNEIMICKAVPSKQRDSDD